MDAMVIGEAEEGARRGWAQQPAKEEAWRRRWRLHAMEIYLVPSTRRDSVSVMTIQMLYASISSATHSIPNSCSFARVGFPVAGSQPAMR